MDGMHAHSFWGRTDSDLAVAHTYEYEFAVHDAICEVSLTQVNERADNTGAMVAFVSYTYLDDAGTPQRVDLWDDPKPIIAHTRLIRIEWYLRIWDASATGILNVFYWARVS
jgi:hypothetical protein